jgi:hypothetical protein
VYFIHYEAPDWLASTVTSALASSVPLQVAVINNGGDLPPLPAEVVELEPVEGTGFTDGFNRAASHFLARDDVRRDVVAIGCHDVALAPDAFAVLLGALEADPLLGAVGPWCGGSGEPIGHRHGVDLVAWTSGALLVLRREALEQVGLMDTTLGSYCEDVDWCHRARRAGWDVGRHPGASAALAGTRHRHRAERLTRRNKVVMAYRYGAPAPAELLRLESKVLVVQVGHNLHPRRRATVAPINLVMRCAGLAEGVWLVWRERRRARRS